MPTKPTFVLVHGAWHGGWCWKRLAPLLRSEGYEVYTPTLTGQGDRIQSIHPDINLDTHIQDIVNLLHYEDLHNVILVGHSYGGMVITGVEAKVPERLSQLVFFDAFLPENGKSMNNYVPGDPFSQMQSRAEEIGNRLPLSWFATIEKLCEVTNQEDVEWMAPRLCDQPFNTFSQPVVCKPAVKRSFIQTSTFPAILEALGRAKAQGIRIYELISAGHDAMVTQPNEFAKILLELV